MEKQTKEVYPKSISLGNVKYLSVNEAVEKVPGD